MSFPWATYFLRDIKLRHIVGLITNTMSYFGFHKCAACLEGGQKLHVKENSTIIFYCVSSYYSLSNDGERSINNSNLQLVLEE